MQTEPTRLDGNAAAGTLSEVFGRDVTAAVAICATCSSSGAVGALLEYGQGMGVILRCPTCEAVMLRIVRTPRFMRVDASGIAILTIPDSQ